MTITVWGLSLSFSVFLAAMAQAAAASPADVPQSAPTCQLHVWPAAGLNDTYYGWFHGGIADGAAKDRRGYPSFPDDPLTMEKQATTLRTLPLATWLNLPQHQIVVHNEALESRVARTTAGRLQADASPCYAELVLDDVFSQQDVIYGRFLRTLFRFRDFGTGGDTPVRTFGTWTRTRLNAFPPAAGAPAEPALAELPEALGKTIEQFGAALNKPAKGKTRKKP
jgi:hypothetical protein